MKDQEKSYGLIEVQQWINKRKEFITPINLYLILIEEKYESTSEFFNK